MFTRTILEIRQSTVTPDRSSWRIHLSNVLLFSDSIALQSNDRTNFTSNLLQVLDAGSSHQVHYRKQVENETQLLMRQAGKQTKEQYSRHDIPVLHMGLEQAQKSKRVSQQESIRKGFLEIPVPRKCSPVRALVHYHVEVEDLGFRPDPSVPHYGIEQDWS